MKFKKVLTGALAAAVTMSCLTLSAGAISSDEAEAIVAAMQEGDIFLARFNNDGSLIEPTERADIFEIYEDPIEKYGS